MMILLTILCSEWLIDEIISALVVMTASNYCEYLLYYVHWTYNTWKVIRKVTKLCQYVYVDECIWIYMCAYIYMYRWGGDYVSALITDVVIVNNDHDNTITLIVVITVVDIDDGTI